MLRMLLHCVGTACTAFPFIYQSWMHKKKWRIHTSGFLCNVYPCTPFPPYFCNSFYLFGPLPPTNGALVARPQYGMGRV